ncbi:arylamine N-acetyltransferase [Bacillus sp. 2205SS5-2]|uniref:arylamine N-acetyltransferase n=1 Tax=Bacillus sp. 2205SS5-2 TaxID=3109031 RepID=UPI00300430ED
MDRYVNHLYLQKEPPGGNYLQRLIQHHLLRIPYETISKFHYFVHGPQPIPAFSEFMDNLEHQHWGGTCFTLNINFARLLNELGFQTNYVRVNPGHLGLMVTLEGRRYYVDVGYGSPIMKPVVLDQKKFQVLHGFGEEITFTQKDYDVFEIDRRSNGKSFVKKRIEWKPLTEAEISTDIDQSYEDSADNQNMRRITAVKFQGNTCYYLKNESLKVMTYRNIREYQMRSYPKWRDAVQKVYGFQDEALEAAVKFLQDRDVTIFK